MFEEVVCGELLVLVACEVSLDDHVAVETHGAQTLNGLVLLLCNADLPGLVATLLACSSWCLHWCVKKGLEVSSVLVDKLKCETATRIN